MSQHEIGFILNGSPVTACVEASWTLAMVLREQLGATGTKVGCEIGVCGACSVLIDDVLLSGCLVPAIRANGKAVVTVEGLEEDGMLSSLQEAFINHGGFQCGICTPGQLVASTALLAEFPRPTQQQVEEWMMGNLCRCTGYYGITRAIMAASCQESEK